jgi:pimeloyl-ACP methyl ester carboxylesterase
MDAQSHLGPSLVPSADKLTLDIKHDSIVPVFCQDGSAEVKQLVLENFRVEPAIPFTNKASLTASRFGKVNKYYIHTTEDHAIGIKLQQQMAAAAHISQLYAIKSGHCPFLTQPDKVTEILLRIAF